MPTSSRAGAPTRRPHLRAACVAAVVVCAAIPHAADAQSRWSTLDEFLTRGVGLDAKELAALARGVTVARMLPTADQQDVAVFGAVQVDVPRAFFIERQRDFPRALRTANRTQVQVFSDPAVASDVQALEATRDDLDELRGCRPGSCNFKLPATDMERFRGTIGSGPDARPRVAEVARQRIVGYVTDYRARGNAALVVYDDRGNVRSSEALAALLRDSSFAFTAIPSLGRHLAEFPRSSLPGATEVMFWARDEMPHLRPIIRVTHETIYAPPERPDVTVVVAKQIYADHYFEAGLETLAAVDRVAPGASDPRAITVVAVRRYRFDHLPSGGLLNIRGRVGNGLRDNVLADLTRLKRETEADWAKMR